MGAIHQALLSIAAPTGGPITTPSDVASIWAWYETGRVTGYSNGDPITPWTDQSGNGRHFTQATSGSRPKYDTSNALNGHAVADFSTSRFWDGPDMSANGQGTGSSKQGHVLIVVKGTASPANADQTGLMHLSTAGAAGHYPFTNGLIYDPTIKGSRDDALTPGVSLGAWRVFERHMIASSAPATTDGDTELKLDGASIFFGNIVGAGWPSVCTLGKNFNGQFFNGGFVAGLYLFSQKLGTTDRTNMIDYINGRFALTSV
jgi:hypothetical protein